jgi:cell volume regulation protein A
MAGMNFPSVLGLPLETILVGVSVLLLLSVLSSTASSRLGIPALLLFVGLGMLAGSEGPGGIEFDYPRLAQSLGVVALALILFSGGMDTDWGSIRLILWRGISLATLGVGLTTVLVGWFAMQFLEFSVLEGLLLGAIVSSTDAAAVFSVLRARNVRLRGSLKGLLEFESGSNDPMAVFLTVGFISLISSPSTSMVELVPLFVHQMSVGALLGYAMGQVMLFLLNRLKLEYEGLYDVLSLALALLTYGATASLGGSGFLAVYLAGIIVGNGNLERQGSLSRFHDAVAWLMQILMFLSLGLQVFPSRVVPVIGIGLVLSLVLMFIARPLSVFVALMASNLRWNEKLLISWVGLRGAVPIVLAMFPLIAGLPEADIIFNLVFFIVLTSVLLQGATLPLVAWWLGLLEPSSETLDGVAFANAPVRRLKP